MDFDWSGLIPGIKRIIADYSIINPFEECANQIRSANLNNVKWIVENFWFYFKTNSPVYYFTTDQGPIYLFKGSCVNSQIEICEYLIETFNISIEDVRAHDNYILRVCCERGDLKMIKYLLDKFPFTIADIRSKDNYILRYACGINGYIGVLKFIMNFTDTDGKPKFNLTKEDVIQDNNLALRYTCIYGNFEMLKWLINIFNLTSEDIKSNNNMVLRFAREHGYNDIVKWLKLTFYGEEKGKE